ncbi:interleukin 4 receptor, tandem duplicate 1 [Hoplias malabaricus]|uniref:interleukin 4 receptor, tandem duplicate 1 n=1 Tax=Hoplias malabaricus TaxID=27720 RepID=UPI003462FDA8
MFTAIQWLNLFLVITIALTETYEPQLECLNDYDSEMVCTLSSEKLLECSELKLNVSIISLEKTTYPCEFENVSHNECNCKFQVPGFVITEDIQAEVWRGGDILVSKTTTTESGIKPKRPTIVSVNQTQNGDFLIIWDTNYSKDMKTFLEKLSTVLIYGVKGSSETLNISVQNGITEYEIVGSKLQPNSEYTVMAKVSTAYNKNERFSDYSEPYEFITPPSTQNILKILVPILCVILVIFIFTLFYCYVKIVKEWWNTIPTPKITPSFEKSVPYLSSLKNDFSPVYLENSKLDPVKEKTWLAPARVDVSNEDLQSFGRSCDSVSYAHVEENITGNEGQCELLEEYKSTDHVQSDQANIDIQRESGRSSGSSFSNRCYLGSDSSSSSFLNKSVTHTAYPSDLRDSSSSNLCTKLDPVIQTDFEYGPCDSCSGPTKLTPLTISSTDIVVVPGYQSVNELLDNGHKVEDQAFISHHNNVNLIGTKTNAKKLLDVTFSDIDNIIIPVDDGYQSFPGSEKNTWSLDHSTELEPNMSLAVHAPSFKSLCDPVLHISAGIQIDSSYQRV